MADYNVLFYNINTTGTFSTTVGGTYSYAGPATADGTGVITDNEAGVGGQHLDDDSSGGEQATATVTVGGLTSTASTADAELAWTVRDTVTGEEFQVVQFQVELGAAAGSYMMSEIPLVVGRSYETVAYDSNPNANSGDPAFNYADHAASGFFADGTVHGTAGDDVIDGTFTDIHGDIVTESDDTIEAGAGNDIVSGYGGEDSIDGGSGDDTIYGDTGPSTADTTQFQWSTQGVSDEASVASGLTGLTANGDIQVQLTVAQEANFTSANMELNDPLYDYNAMNDSSSIEIYGGGSGTDQNAATITLDFSAAASGLSDEVSDVTFGIHDIDELSGQFIDQITVKAFDADGNEIPVTAQLGSTTTLTSVTNADGSVTVTSIVDSGGSGSTDAATGFAEFSIAGPVSYIEIDYNNIDTDYGNHAIRIGDIELTTIPEEPITGNDDIINGDAGDDFIYGQGGNDTIDGGADNDTLYGGAGNDDIIGGTGADTMEGGSGNDTITFSDGDSVDGGTGDDTFTYQDLGEATNGTITIVGGSGGETLDDGDPNSLEGDTLNLGFDADMSTLNITSTSINVDGNTTYEGTIQMDDGTLLEFSEIENIICFTPGTRIATPAGARDIATLKIGDLIVTRDHGLQPIRWIQQRTVPAVDGFAPIRIKPGVVIGQDRDLLVSPQHRMLFQGYRAELLFGESEVLVAAKDLLDGKLVTRDTGGDVTYIHMMFDEHEVIFAEGAATESFHPGSVGVTAVSNPAREELFALFPELRSNIGGYGQTARRCLRRQEANLLQV